MLKRWRETITLKSLGITLSLNSRVLFNFSTSIRNWHHDSYIKALNCSLTSEETHSLTLNHSLTFLKVKQFDAALSDFESISITSKSVEKALFCKAQALYNLQRYQKCCEILKILCMKCSNIVEVKEKCTWVINWLMKQESDRYKFEQSYTKVIKLHSLHLDHVTYVDSVSVKVSGSQGCSLFTTEAVKADNLFLCKKAFVHVFINDAHTTSEQDQNLTLLINAETDSVIMRAQAELIWMIVQKLYWNLSLISAITDLHHSTYKSVSVSKINDTSVIDT